MFKLLTMLKQRNMSFAELFRSCDVNNDQEVDLQELASILNGLDLYERDCEAIHKFLDIDQNGEVTQEEFMQQMEKAEKLHSKYQRKLEGLDVSSSE